MSAAEGRTPAPGQEGTTSDGRKRVDLVLEGGGVKGIALAGALEVLEERGYLVNRVAGSSAGAIAGTLATAGISGAELVEILRSTDYRKFQDGPWWTGTIVGKAVAVLLHNGIHPGTYVTQWLEKQLVTHGDPSRTGTFADLLYEDPDPEYEAEGARKYRLVVTASDLTAGRLRYLPTDAESFGTTPGRLRVVESVRASISIPVFFRPVRWKNAFGKPAVLVDGGMLSNFPVSVFDRTDGRPPRWPTFGVKLSAKPEAGSGVENRIRGPLSFAKALVDTVTGFYDRMHIDSSHAIARTIFIDTGAVRATEFDLSPQQQEMLYRKGREAATKFLDGAEDQEAWDFAAYTARFRSG